MISRENILGLLHSPGYKPLSTGQLAKRLALPEEHLEWLEDLLEQLQLGGEIALLDDGKWHDPARQNLLIGRLSRHERGFGFVSPAADRSAADVFIPGRDLSGAMDRDIVLVKCRRVKEKRSSGRIIKILRRAREKFVGTFLPSRGARSGTVTPDDPSLGAGIAVGPENTAGAESGDKVLAKILEEDSSEGHGSIQAKVIKILGPENSPDTDELAIIHQFNLPEGFPRAVLEQADSIPYEPDGSRSGGRRDLSEFPTVAIDPENARDCDDALSAYYDRETGHEVVMVHIADVSSHVPHGNAVDREAGKRGLSVYLVNSFIPMIPEDATRNKLSFAPGKKRLAKTVELRFNSSGKLVSNAIFRSEVTLDWQMSYSQAGEMLEKAGDENSSGPRECPAEQKRLVRKLDKLAFRLHAGRQRAGSVDLDVPEYEIETGQDGRVSTVTQIERDRSHGLVEEFMLLANITVANFLKEKKLPAIYRVHEEPEEEDLRAFADFVETVLERKINPSDRAAIQKLLAEVSGTDFSEAVSMELLRCMKKARYTPEPAPHFALNFPVYCHFTSPIRRYPDLVIHQVLDEHFNRAQGAGGEKIRWEMMLDCISRRCTLREAAADEAEREIIKVKLLRFLNDRGTGRDEVFNGIITGVKEFGFFAQLREFSVEGLVKTSSLKDDCYQYLPEKRALAGRRRKKVFRLGQKVRLRIENVDIAKRRLDFTLCEEN